jgi:hypothetical protein
MEMNDKLNTSAALPQGNSLRYPLGWRLGGQQSHSGHGGWKKYLELLPGVSSVAGHYTNWAIPA